MLCLLVALGGAAMIVREYLQYQQGASVYAGLKQAALPGGWAGGDNTAGADEAPAVDFEALRQINPDVAGWLVCEGTPIDYPVVQGENNSRYLTYLLDGSQNKAGCLFIDYENSSDFTDKNTVIYGHNLLDGSMLSSIVDYGQQGYYDLHPTMRLHTPKGISPSTTSASSP